MQPASNVHIAALRLGRLGHGYEICRAPSPFRRNRAKTGPGALDAWLLETQRFHSMCLHTTNRFVVTMPCQSPPDAATIR